MHYQSAGTQMADWQFSTNSSLYLRNGARQGHSYYGMLIGTRMCSIKWHYFCRPTVTSNNPKQPHFHHKSAPYENGLTDQDRLWYKDFPLLTLHCVKEN